MQTFAPYITIEDTPLCLCLEETRWRKNLHFFVFRVMPLFLMIPLVIFVVSSYDKVEISKGIVLLTTILYVIPAAILLTRTYVTKVKMDKLSIALTIQTLGGKRETSYAVADIANIRCRRRGGKAPGFFYFLNFKIGGKRQRLITISRLNMTKEKKEFIHQKLRNVTGLEVVDV